MQRRTFSVCATALRNPGTKPANAASAAVPTIAFNADLLLVIRSSCVVKERVLKRLNPAQAGMSCRLMTIIDSSHVLSRVV
jgi:hypothetical protein